MSVGHGAGGRSIALAARETLFPLWLVDHLCVVTAGVAIARHEAGPGIRRAELLFAGDVIGDGVFGGRAPSTLHGVVPTSLDVFSGEDVDALLASQEQARSILEAMAERVRRAENFRYNLRTASVRARLARLLLDWCQTYDTRHVPGPFGGGVSIAHVADIIGSTRPTVHRTLLSLERAGSVVIEHGGVTIEDMDAIRKRSRATDSYLSAGCARTATTAAVAQRVSA